MNICATFHLNASSEYRHVSRKTDRNRRMARCTTRKRDACHHLLLAVTAWNLQRSKELYSAIVVLNHHLVNLAFFSVVLLGVVKEKIQIRRQRIQVAIAIVLNKQTSFASTILLCTEWSLLFDTILSTTWKAPNDMRVLWRSIDSEVYASGLCGPTGHLTFLCFFSERRFWKRRQSKHHWFY